ncbi:TPA: hypothetical protein EYP66_01750 [Candidatus Poribacteria bacterium]|nr:hypothetical protein [Candidatus Poribacteria bacterium]
MFSSRLKIFFHAIFWSILFIAFYFLFWRGSLDELKKESDNISTIERALAQTQKYISDWPVTAEEELQQAEEDLEEFLAKIPDKENVPEVLRKIQEYGVKNSQLNLRSIENMTKEQEEEPERGMTKKREPKKEREEGKYAKGTYKLVASGNYFDIIKFIRDLETMERLINVEGFNFKNSGDEDRIDIDLTFSIFYAKSEEEFTPGEERSKLVKDETN